MPLRLPCARIASCHLDHVTDPIETDQPRFRKKLRTRGAPDLISGPLEFFGFVSVLPDFGPPGRRIFGLDPQGSTPVAGAFHGLDRRLMANRAVRANRVVILTLILHLGPSVVKALNKWAFRHSAWSVPLNGAPGCRKTRTISSAFRRPSLADAERDAAALLADARRTDARIPALGADLRPRGIAAACAIQARTADLIGAATAGWKVAITPDSSSGGADPRAALLCDRPFSRGTDSPVTAAADRF